MRWEEEEVAGQRGHLLWGNLSLLGLAECWISALSLQGHRVSLKGGWCNVNMHTCASSTSSLCQELLCQHLGEQDSFLQDVQPKGQIQADQVPYQQHLSLFWVASSDNNMVSLLCYCYCYSSGKSSFHRKLSCGKPILPEVWQQTPQAGRQHSGPSGKEQMDRKSTCSPKLFKSKCSFAVAL